MSDDKKNTERRPRAVDEISEGLVISTRAVYDFGPGSKGVTLSKKWLDIQKWLGKDVDELVSVADSIVVLAPPEKRQDIIAFIKAWEKEREKNEKKEREEDV